MAETNSIASRMEKLAKLKRMKLGLAGADTAQAEKPAPVAVSNSVEAAVAPTPEVHTPEPEMTPPVSTVEVEQNTAAAAMDSVPKDDFESAFSDTVTMADLPDAPELPEAPELPHTQDAVADTDHEAESAETDPATDPAFDFAAQETAESALESADQTAITDDVSDTELPADLMDDKPDFDLPDDFEPEEFTVAALSDTESATDGADTETTEKSPLEAAADADESAGIAALAGVAGVGAAAATAFGSDAADDEAALAEIPDFAAAEIAPELLDNEFADETSSAPAPSASGDAVDGPVTLTFDESRSTLLNHVSRQMNCSIEDVVVTALDWYLDALFGEEDAQKSA